MAGAGVRAGREEDEAQSELSLTGSAGQPAAQSSGRSYNRYGDQTRTNRNGVARWLELSPASGPG